MPGRKYFREGIQSWLLVASMTFACWLACSGTSLAIHFGEPLNADQHPSVGKIVLVDDSGKPISTGTGTLIAPDLVLTVAHVVIKARTPYQISFQLDADPKTDYRGMAYRIHPEYYGLTSYGPDSKSLAVRSQASDVAIVRLIRPVPGINEFFGLSSSTPARSSGATVVGYGQDESKKGGRRRSGSLKFLALKHDYLMFGTGGGRFQRCDHGDSGGPLLVQQGERTEIVALVHGGVDHSEFKHLVSDEYGLYVSVSNHLPWIERTKAELGRIPNSDAEYVFAIRNVIDEVMPALSLDQFVAMLKAGTPAVRMLQHIVDRGASDPIPEDLAKAFVKEGFPKGRFIIAKNPRVASDKEK